MIFANLLWTLGLLAGAESTYGTVLYIGVVRGFATIISCYIIAKIKNYSLDFKSYRDLKISVIRAIICAFQQIITSYGFIHLPPSLVYTIANVGPIIVFIIDYFKNSITVTYRQAVGVVISTFGLLVAVNSLVIMHWLGY